MDIKNILKKAVEEKASDVFIIAGLPVSTRKHGIIIQSEGERLLPPDTKDLLREIYSLANHRNFTILEETGDDDFSFAIQGLSRFRVSAYKQRGAFSAVIRIVTFDLPNPVDLHIPKDIIELGDEKKGMVLITGAVGSGKSTTMACIIDHINKNKTKHIITLEDPLEYLHKHECSIVSQREINVDAENYVTALRSALRQSPDVVLLGDMNDYETIDVATTAAETGHLLLSTMHTIGAANTIDRIIDIFPINQQRQIAVRLSMVLNAVISQQLVPTTDGSMMPVFEIVKVTPEIRKLIREKDIAQLADIIYTSESEHMTSMDANLIKLCREGIITGETALTYATNPETMKQNL